jgi:hypothetical protein
MTYPMALPAWYALSRSYYPRRTLINYVVLGSIDNFVVFISPVTKWCSTKESENILDDPEVLGMAHQ